MTTPPPTAQECCDWVSEHCATIFDSFVGTGSVEEEEMVRNVAIALDSITILVGALDVPAYVSDNLKSRIQALRTRKASEQVVRQIQAICDECRLHIAKSPSLVRSQFREFQLEKPRILPPTKTLDTSTFPDQKPFWFRHYFVGKPYITLIGRSSQDENASPVVIISVVKERADKEPKANRYRIIARGIENILHSSRHIVKEKTAKETESRLEQQGKGQSLDCGLPVSDQKRNRRRPLRSISSAIISGANASSHAQVRHHATRIMRAAVKAAYEDLDFRHFRELSAEATILAGLEKDLMCFDEMEVQKFYKFGVLTVRNGQRTEEEWFANSDLSAPLERFLNILGKPVELEGYKGYAAGLDTKTGESGKTSYAASWRECEIMFHVAPLMPWRDNDKQQVNRKRYIGNDIVCIVFVEGDEPTFDPDIIRSQFLHVYIIIRPDSVNGREAWRIQVASKKDVQECRPLLPSPSVIYDEHHLREFILLKLINAENAALKTSEKLSVPNSRARASVLQALGEIGLKFSEAPLDRNNNNNRNDASDDDDDKRLERPKSAGAQRVPRGNMRSLRAALSDHPPRPMTPDIRPLPVPTSSRSSMLRDWKNLGRRKSSNTGSSPQGSGSPVPWDYSNPSSRGASPLHQQHTTAEEHPPRSVSAIDSAEGKSQHPLSIKASKSTGSTENCKNMTRSRSRFTSLPRRSTHYSTNETSSVTGGIRSRAQNLVTSVMGRRTSRHQQQPPPPPSSALDLHAAGGLIRSKAFTMDPTGKLIQSGD